MTVDVVVGAGPAGLAAAAELARAGRRPVVLERSDRVGSSWLSRYDSLRLNTTRWWSELPGLRIPREYGTWVSAVDYAAYLDSYARERALDVSYRVSVLRVGVGDAGWVVETSAGSLPADNVVVAAGYDREPAIPDWPGRRDFVGRLLHSSDYRNALPFAGERILVVGAGNSGTDIAVDLARGGAAEVWLSIRSAPQIVPRTVGGLPMQAVAIAARPLPAWVGDSVVRAVRALVHGDLSRFGVPRTAEPLSVQFARGDVVPVIDVGFVRALKKGELRIVSAVEGFDGSRVLLADGCALKPDVVVAATGYGRGLEPLVGHLGVLDQRGRPIARRLQGLYFVGYSNPLSGNLRELGIQAQEIARDVVEAARAHASEGGSQRALASREPT